MQDEQRERERLVASLATLTDDVRTLRETQANPQATADRLAWQHRRSVRVERVELRALQQQLEEEARAKRHAEEELVRTAAEKDAAIQAVRAELDVVIVTLRQDLAQLHGQLRSPVAKPRTSCHTYLDLEPMGAMGLSPSTSHRLSPDLETPGGPGQARVALTGDRTASMSRAPLSSSPSEVGGRGVDSGAIPPLSLVSKDASFSLTAAFTDEPDAPFLSRSSHSFSVTTLATPAKCGYCSSLLRGLLRQGVVCSHCKYLCHVRCVAALAEGHEYCPVPAMSRMRSVAASGLGTAAEGWVMTPKVGGVRKGWRHMCLIICDGIVTLHERSAARRGDVDDPAAAMPAYVLDLRHPNFTVTSVTQADVIHAASKDIPRILKVRHRGDDASNLEVLILTESLEDKAQWTRTLTTLHSLASRLPKPTTSLFCSELVTSLHLPEAKDVHCAARIHHRFFLGTPTGLVLVDPNSVFRATTVGDLKKITQLEYVAAHQVLLLLGTRKSTQLRIFPATSALKARDESVKVTESKARVCMRATPTRASQKTASQ